MTIMQQCSRAQDRTLGVWFLHIQQGTVKLTRFQRSRCSLQHLSKG